MAYITKKSPFMEVLTNHFVPGMTFLLQGGYYDFPQGLEIVKDLQLVSIGNQVSFHFGYPAGLMIYAANVYVEGVSFPKGGESISCAMKGSLTMHKCHVRTGRKACDDYPECNGGSGCMATGRNACDRTGRFGNPSPSGIPGSPGVKITFHSYGYFEECDIEECGGGGILCHGDGSMVHVKACKVHKNHQAGLEARNGGCLEAFDNDIYSNAFHGILIGPSAGACSIIHNRIYENKKEGIIVRESMNGEIDIKQNRIYHNLPFGISLDRCQVHIERNDIFENGFYGIHGKNLTTAVVENNDIYSNKCGGIHMGVNFSGRFTIARNTVRDHSGPWLLKQELPQQHSNISAVSNLGSDPDDFRPFLPKGETSYYSISPTEIDNEIKTIKEDIFHPKRKIELVQKECAFCRSTKDLFECPGCNIASYCNDACRENHREKHKGLCCALADEYCVTVDFKKTCHLELRQILAVGSRKAIGQGPKPNPKNNAWFVVKIQTGHLNCHPLQELVLYDKSTTLYGSIQSPEVFHIIMECGVLGQQNIFTSKTAFFYATFADSEGKKLKIQLAELAPYQEW